MIIGHVIKENALMVVTFDEKQVNQLCSDLYEILQAAYYIQGSRVSMFGNPWFDIDMEE